MAVGIFKHRPLVESSCESLDEQREIHKQRSNSICVQSEVDTEICTPFRDEARSREAYRVEDRNVVGIVDVGVEIQWKSG